MRSKNIKVNLYKNKLNLILFKNKFLNEKKFKKISFNNNLNIFNVY